MSKSFAELFEESLAKHTFREGDVINAKVVAIDSDFVTVDAGLKSEDIIPVEQFRNAEGKVEAAIGDTVEVVVESLADIDGKTVLSREKAKRLESWTLLSSAHEQGELVTGLVSGKVKGGFTVELGGVKAFLPGSLVDVRPTRDAGNLEGKVLEFKVIKVDPKRNNVVVSRRAAVEAGSSAERQALLENLEEGQIVKGIVKSLTDYGCFVDLGGIDGLLHITDMSWKRIKHPSEIVAVGDEISVKVLKFDRDNSRVSLGLKQLGEDPWVDISRRYPTSTRLFGKVTNLTDYGCFVEIETGVEGLVHVSEMDWTNKNAHPSKIVQVGDEVEVMVLEIDEQRRRISLGIKQCQQNPWQEFSQTHQKGELISGKIKSITDFGIFVGLDGSIDGLIHVSDISWQKPGETAIRDYKKGQELTAVILSIDPERERIALGLKQLEGDVVGKFLDEHGKGDVVKAIVIEVDEKGATVRLDENVTAYLAAGEIKAGKVDDAREHLQVDEEIEVKITSLERKTGNITVSIKAKDQPERAKVAKKETPAPVVGMTLGDLMKEQMGNKDN
jgi:small subunit ribosomal protein S1